MIDRHVRDPIYGMIHLPDLAWKVIDTPLYQRTRRIQQLGIVEYVYPSAVHTRFSHMIGTAHLAICVCDKLNIQGDDRIILILSALLHDIAHSVLSHIYEQAGGSSHEKRSEMFIDAIAEQVPEILIYTPAIKNIINGECYDNNKPYMSQIVANHANGLDVDKLDYMVRDCYFTGIKCLVEVDRIISAMTLVDNNVAYNEKILEDIANVFRTRYDLHRRVYQHRVVRVISVMVCEILRENRYEPKTIEEWLTFTDDWFNQLRITGNERTKDIFHDLDTRCIWEASEEHSLINSTDTIRRRLSSDDHIIHDECTISCGYKGCIMVHTGKLVDIIELVPKDIIIKRKIICSH